MDTTPHLDRTRTRSRRVAPFVLMAAVALLLIASICIVGMTVYDQFSDGLERAMQERTEGHAVLVARMFDPETLKTSLMSGESDTDDQDASAVSGFLFEKVSRAAHALGIRRIVIFRRDGKVAVDSAGVNSAGMIDEHLRVDDNDIARAIDTASPVSSVLYELEDEQLAKSSYALVPGTGGESALIASVELPVNYAERLAQIRAHVVNAAMVLGAFIVSLTLFAAGVYATMQRRLREQERKAELAEFSAAIAHEIKNPLAAMLTGVQLIARTSDERGKKLTAQLEREIRMLDRIVKDFLAFARGARREAVSTTVGAVLAGALDQLTETQRAWVNITGDQSQSMRIDHAALVQALGNLLKNACEAVAQGEAVAPTVQVLIRSTGDRMVFTVKDSGPGVPDEIRRKLFEPFTSAKSEGTGLGLAIVKRLVGDLGGNVRLLASSGQGSSFEVDVPINAREARS